jgi:Zn-dependent peptidase ImmA (M78 family)
MERGETMGDRAEDAAARVMAVMKNRRRGSIWICARLGVPVYEWPLTGRIKAVYTQGAIGYAPGLPYEEREHLILHELGHHLMHRDLAPAHAFLSMDGAAFTQVEYEAERFAYVLTLPRQWLRTYLARGWTIPDLAAYYERTPAWVERRIAMMHEAMSHVA